MYANPIPSVREVIWARLVEFAHSNSKLIL